MIVVNTPVAGNTTSPLNTSFTIALGTVAVDQHIVVCIASGNNSVSSVTDNLGNTYNQDRAQVFYSYVYIYSTKVTSGGSCTITVNLSGASNAAGLAYLVEGLLTTAAHLDQVASANGGADTTPTVTTPATTQADEVVFGSISVFLGAGTDPMTAGSGYTLTNHNSTPTSGQTVSLGAEYKIISATGAQVVDATLSFSSLWDIAAATYKAAPSTFSPKIMVVS